MCPLAGISMKYNFANILCKRGNGLARARASPKWNFYSLAQNCHVSSGGNKLNCVYAQLPGRRLILQSLPPSYTRFRIARHPKVFFIFTFEGCSALVDLADILEIRIQYETAMIYNSNVRATELFFCATSDISSLSTNFTRWLRSLNWIFRIRGGAQVYICSP